jgi:hypothetical protein
MTFIGQLLRDGSMYAYYDNEIFELDILNCDFYCVEKSDLKLKGFSDY